MTVSMTEEQSQAVAAGSGEPVRLVDPKTHAAYVLVPADEYARLASERLVEDSYPLQEEVALAQGWDDPKLDEYNDYDVHRERKS